MFKEIEKVKEIIKTSEAGKIKLFKASEDIDCLIRYIKYLEGFFEGSKDISIYVDKELVAFGKTHATKKE